MKKKFQRTADQVVHQQENAATTKKFPLTHSTFAKTTAFILVIIMMLVVLASTFGAIIMANFNVYARPEEDVRYEIFFNLLRSYADNAVQTAIYEGEEALIDVCQSRNISGLTVDATGKNAFQWQYDKTDSKNRRQGFEYTYYWDGEDIIWNYYAVDESYSPIVVKIYVPEELPADHPLYMADRLVHFGYSLRYWIYAIDAVALILTVFGFVFLMSGAGHRNGYEEVQSGWGTGIPLDILTAGYLLGIFLCFQFAVESGYYESLFVSTILIIASGIFIAIMTLGWCMSIAVRLKLGKWWKNSVVFYVLRIVWKILCRLRTLMHHLLSVMCKIPLVWKTAVAYLGLSFVEFFMIVLYGWNYSALLALWMLGKVILFPVIIYLALVMRKLQRGGKAIAEGDLSYQIDTVYMLPEFKKHGENLNKIGEGMTLAVEQRLKSERMKTELITNVSHDIKTPLTSIINYSDLIEKEPTDNPKITEYAEVLHRQSERLKRLIEDLVEASKASTGNLEVHLAPCEVGVMISQTVGEYEQRLETSQLQLLTRQPENPVKIMADGRRLWRVFDNLMNNICKYSQPGTRVYFTMEEIADQAVISFKNTSREPLNLSPEELMERFVRGDSARNSEGNGLGLSIAKSLTELQKGTMEITVDGDLFKVILRFPVIK